VSPSLLCLVTNRARLARRLGCDEASSTGWLIAQVRAAAHAGVDLVQIREGDLPAAALVALTRRAVDAVRGTRTRVLVNDRADVAYAAGAHGVHLKASSMPPSLVRQLLPAGALVGVSVHDAARAAALSADVDYLIAGTVAPSSSKPGGWPTLGLTGLADIVRAAEGVPVLGIGGLGVRSAGQLRQTGARGLAGIDAFLPAVPPNRFEECVHETVLALRLAFDSPESVP
jgi:thiamine-phosphate pyrophosphorylase